MQWLRPLYLTGYHVCGNTRQRKAVYLELTGKKGLRQEAARENIPQDPPQVTSVLQLG